MPLASEVVIDVQGEVDRVEAAIERVVEELAKSEKGADRERTRVATFTLFVALVVEEVTAGAGQNGQALAFEPIVRLACGIRSTLPVSPATDVVVRQLGDVAA